MTDVVGRFRQVPPMWWVVLAAFLGLMFLVWHSYQCDPYDTDWNDPGQPPTNMDVPKGPVPGEHQPAFRARNWPNSLTESVSSFIGTI